MILFKPEHVLLILGGNKTQTRRLGKKRWNVGAVHQCRTQLVGEPFCRVRILDVRQERLLEIATADAMAEGYASSSDFLCAFEAINGVVWDGEGGVNPLVWVVEFEVAA